MLLSGRELARYFTDIYYLTARLQDEHYDFILTDEETLVHIDQQLC